LSHGCEGLRLWIFVSPVHKISTNEGAYRAAVAESRVDFINGGFVKALLLENISGVAAETFASRGYTVESVQGALDESALAERIAGVSVLGVRSKTPLTRAVIDK